MAKGGELATISASVLATLAVARIVHPSVAPERLLLVYFTVTLIYFVEMASRRLKIRASR